MTSPKHSRCSGIPAIQALLNIRSELLAFAPRPGYLTVTAYSGVLKEPLHRLEARKGGADETSRNSSPRDPRHPPERLRRLSPLAKALNKPEERDAAAAAIRGLIDGIVLTPGEKPGELQITLRGELGKILEWTRTGAEKEKTDTPLSGMSVSGVAGARYQRCLRLDEVWL